MMYIDVRINNRVVASAGVGNISDLADISNYQVVVQENDNPIANLKRMGRAGRIDNHNRKQSIWALVEKVAQFAQGKDFFSHEKKD